ncbi:hypothetical protein Tco_1488772, partial [Tanacetum coccineum]
EIRKSLHLRLGLPLDRPLLRIASAMTIAKEGASGNTLRKGTSLLKDVHVGIPSSGGKYLTKPREFCGSIRLSVEFSYG